MHILILLSYIFASLAFLSGGCPFLKLQMQKGFTFIIFKLGAGAFAPLAGAAGVLGLVLGVLSGAPLAIVLGGLDEIRPSPALGKGHTLLDDPW
jgi:hypothetical protein